MQLPTGLRWLAVPGHPVRYGSVVDRDGQMWLWFHCPVCGDVSKKPCDRPKMISRWALYYADDHCHGRVRRA